MRDGGITPRVVVVVVIVVIVPVIVIIIIQWYKVIGIVGVVGVAFMVIIRGLLVWRTVSDWCITTSFIKIVQS